MDFDFGWQALFHLFLDPAQQERLQDAVQLLDDLLVSLLFLFVGHVFLALAQVEPLVEVVRRRENLRQKEVEQGPELMEIVLKRGARQQQAIATVKLAEPLRDLAVLILELVGLVDDDVFPLKLEQLVHAGSHTFERGEADIELARLKVVFQDVLALSLRRDQVEAADLRAPLFELLLPVGDDGLGDYDHEVALDLLELSQEGQERNRLDRLAQSLNSHTTQKSNQT